MPGAVPVRKAVRTIGVRDVNLNQDHVRLIVGPQMLDVLVDEHRTIVGTQIGRQGREAEWREERVFDRPPVRAGGLGEGRQDQLDVKRASSPLPHTLYCKVFARAETSGGGLPAISGENG